MHQVLYISQNTHCDVTPAERDYTGISSKVGPTFAVSYKNLQPTTTCGKFRAVKYWKMGQLEGKTLANGLHI